MTKEDLLPLLLFGTLLLLMLVAFIIVVLMNSKHRVNHYRMKLREACHKRERDVLNAEITTREDVLDWLSRELHDNISQLLRLTITQLAYARKAPSLQKRTASLVDAEETVSRTLNDLRRLAYKANGERIRKVGLVEAIKCELSYLDSFYAVQHQFNYPDDLPRFDSTKELNIFRIVQEALSNIVRHAEAGFVCITVLYRQSLFLLTITDNGKGWNRFEENVNSGMGLEGMKKRAKMIQGKLAVYSRVGQGTCITLNIKT